VPPLESPSVLTLDEVSIEFGGITALDRVTFDVKAGQICGLIGPNGAGKTTLRSHALASAGIARTFQNLALFGDMTVFDNTMAGGTSVRATKRQLRDRAWELIEHLELVDVASHKAAGLPFGTLKRVELARALMSQPQLLLLDEPAGGLTHSEVKELGDLIVSLRDEFGFAALLVEHHMGLVLGISDHVVALDFGHKIFEGTPAEVKDNPAVVAAYLGRAA
jgi:branched-chain amino acid transport system ATP-binding protein